MSHEFSPHAPEIVGTESRVKNSTIVLSESLLAYQKIAKNRYAQALEIAENIDDKIETSIPFNKNAVYAASLLMLACVRGAQVA